jgi:glycosyltransferase involved in cell wall biosynthesis
MRVLHCITTLEAGGSQRQLALLSRLLPHHGWDVHIAILQDGPLSRTVDPAATIHRIDRRDVRASLALAGLMGRLRPAIVQTWLVHMDLFGGVAALARGVPWIATERSSALGYQPRLSTRLRTLLVGRADALVANSAGGLELWERRGPPLKRLIRNGLDQTATLATPRLPDGVTVAEGAPVIVGAGRLVADKGLRVLLQALALVRRDLPAVVVLCGTGPFERELRRLARESGGRRERDRCRLRPGHGGDPAARRSLRVAQCRRRIPERRAGSDGLRHAGRALGHCRAPRAGGSRGRGVRRRQDAAAVAAAIVTSLRDRSAARARATHAQARARTWAPDLMGAAYDAIYREILDSRRS